MRIRFEQQLSIGQIPIREAIINPKSKNVLDDLLAALKEIYCNEEYNMIIFNLLEKHLVSQKQKTGRNGMNLWCIFVLSQVRLCLNLSYNDLHNQANNHKTLRLVMGVEREYGYEHIEFSYQNIYDNITMLSNELIIELNQVILSFGHNEVFKKKRKNGIALKKR